MLPGGLLLRNSPSTRRPQHSANTDTLRSLGNPSLPSCLSPRDHESSWTERALHQAAQDNVALYFALLPPELRATVDLMLRDLRWHTATSLTTPPFLGQDAQACGSEWHLVVIARGERVLVKEIPPTSLSPGVRQPLSSSLVCTCFLREHILRRLPDGSPKRVLLFYVDRAGSPKGRLPLVLTGSLEAIVGARCAHKQACICISPQRFRSAPARGHEPPPSRPSPRDANDIAPTQRWRAYCAVHCTHRIAAEAERTLTWCVH